MGVMLLYSFGKIYSLNKSLIFFILCPVKRCLNEDRNTITYHATKIFIIGQSAEYGFFLTKSGACTVILAIICKPLPTSYLACKQSLSRKVYQVEQSKMLFVDLCSLMLKKAAFCVINLNFVCPFLSRVASDLG